MKSKSKGTNQGAPTSGSIPAMDRIAKHTAAIKDKVNNHRKMTKSLQVKHTFDVLKEEVWAAMGFIASAINQGALKTDPTGLLTGTSPFYDPVNQLAKEWLVKYDKSNKESEVPPSAKLLIANAAGAPPGTFGKIKYTLKSGVQMIYNAAKACVEFVWRGITKAYYWVKGMIIDGYYWIKDQLIAFVDWCKAKFGKKDAPDVDVNALLEEGKKEYVPTVPEHTANAEQIAITA